MSTPTATNQLETASLALQTAEKRDRYIRQRMQQIWFWNGLGLILLVLLILACRWLYHTRPMYLDPHLLANAIQTGRVPSNELAQLAAMGSLMFWGFIALLVGFIIQMYVAMYSERKLIKLLAPLHEADLKQQQDAAVAFVDNGVTDSQQEA